MRMRFGLIAAAMLAIATTPVAAQEDGFYVGIGGGLSMPEDSNIEGGAINTGASLDLGWAAAGTFGYAYGNGIRSELELGYRSTDVDELQGVAGGSGDFDALSIMVNALYDFHNSSAVTPYIGAGIGWVNLDLGGVTPVGGSTISDRDDDIGYQGIAGVSFQVAEQVELFTEYRYLSTFGDFNVDTNAGAGVNTEYADHSFMVGIRFNLTAPPPPPPAPEPVAAAEPEPEPVVVPEPEPMPLPGPYVVFFDWDASDIRADAAAIIQEAAANAQKFGIVTIQVTGHADRSGSDAYNLALSQRRADAVMAELVRLGIGADQIAVLWKGESEPLVATDDGVREAKNRRVEIVYQ